MAVAVLIVVLAVLGLAIAGSIRPVAQETALAAMRVEGLRAHYAAESGAVILIGTRKAGLEPPSSGDEIVWPQQIIQFIDVPSAGGWATLGGVSGFAQRRQSVLLE